MVRILVTFKYQNNRFPFTLCYTSRLPLKPERRPLGLYKEYP